MKDKKIKLMNETFRADRFVVFTPDAVNQEPSMFQFGPAYESRICMREGEYVYELKGVVKKVETEVKTNEKVPVKAGYKWGSPNGVLIHEVLAIEGACAWVKTSSPGVCGTYTTMYVSSIPRRKATHKLSKLEIVPIKE